jgi:hypothetical protein
VAGASVYSTLISIIEGGHAEFVKQSCCWPRDNASVESAAKVERRASSFPRILHAGFRRGLNPYADLIARDSGTTPRDGVRVTYLGTNGYQFEFDGHALLVDPIFRVLIF